MTAADGRTPVVDGPRLAARSGRADALAVLVHGYGSNGADMIALAPLWAQAMPNLAFAAPDAPGRCPWGPNGRQWWALDRFDRPALAAGVRGAAAALDGFIDAELQRLDVAPDRLLLVGFSQGTMMSLHVGLRRDPRPAGIIGYSGLMADILPEGGGALPPVLLVHGTADAVVPIAGSHEAERLLREAGGDVALHIAADLDHGVDAGGLEAGLDFAWRVLGA